MTTPQRDRVEELLGRLLDAPEIERMTLDQWLGTEEAAVQREVRAMLELLPKAQEYFHGFEAENTRRDMADGMVGPYRILARVGSGGMGTVYRGERNDGEFRREVAIKFLTPLAIGHESWRRFQAEKRILAKLQHPNIAQLLDAGVSEHGTPFLVMEWVGGEPIDRYLARQKPSIQVRLLLFLKICDAVQTAHQQLVVHRDIKPANILVTSTGTPKLLDFGIAKALAGDADEMHTTRPQDRIMTLGWASPEQLRGEPIHTSSDVYSLGLMLYLILTGREAQERRTSNPAETIRMICEVDPRPPSQAADLPQESRQLRGDLDNIVLRALKKSPADRYATARELAEDLQRFLDGRPVRAAVPALGYRAGKFLKRNRWACMAVAVVSTVLAGAATSVIWQARVAERERLAAVAARNTADAERAKAEARSTEALLARAAAAEEQSLAEQSRLAAQKRLDEVRALANSVMFVYQARLAQTGAETALRARMARDSMAYLDRLAAQESDDPALLLEVSAGYRELARLLGDRAAPNLGDFAGAAAALTKARKLLQSALRRSPASLDVAKQLAALACLESRVLQKPSSGCVLAWEGLQRRTPRDIDVIRGLKTAYFWQTPDPARPCEHLAKYLTVAARNRDLQSNDPMAARDLALGHKNMATCLGKADFAGMKRHVEQAITIDQERVQKENSPQARLDLSFSIGMMATYFELQEKYDQALPLFEQVAALRRKNYDADLENVWLQQRTLAAFQSVFRMQSNLGLLPAARQTFAEMSRLLARMKVSGDFEWHRILMMHYTQQARMLDAAGQHGPDYCDVLRKAKSSYGQFTTRESLDAYKAGERAWVERELSRCGR